MKYVTGIHALNLNCDLDTTGDWHTSSLDWNNITWKNTETAFFGEYGIFKTAVPNHTGTMLAANHIRAILDLLYDRNFSVAQGMCNDYICNDKYNITIFEKVYSMHVLPYWNEIDNFMEKEYKLRWLLWKDTNK